MQMVTTYTAADDSRLQQPAALCRILSCINPHGAIKLIPFSDKTTAVRKECGMWGIDVVNPSPIIDECGKKFLKTRNIGPVSWHGDT